LVYATRASSRRGKVFFIDKEIESKVSLPVAYRTRQCDTITVPQATTFAWRIGEKNAPEKPRWIVIGFQTGKSGDQMQNPAIFDHVNLKKYIRNAEIQQIPRSRL